MDAVCEKTQKELGAVIQAPKLTEKLLSRPPFRFLHDVVMAVQKASGFPDGLFSADQMDSAKVADKKAKVDFLQQLISVVEAAIGAPVAARPSKIVAGEEPEKTNELLQQLAACAALSPAQKAAAVKKVTGGEPAAAPAAAAPAPPPAPPAAAAAPASTRKESSSAAKPAPAPAPQETEEERTKRREEERRRRHEEKKREAEKAKAAAAATETSSRPKEESSSPAAAAAAAAAAGASSGAAAEPERHRHREEKKRESVDAVADTATTSARKAPPRPKPTHQVIEAQNAAGATPAVGVIRESKRSKADAVNEEDEKEDWQKVAEQYDAKPAARTAAVAEDVDVKGLLGQQALKAKRDQEAAARRGEDGADGAAAASAARSDGGIVIRSSKNTASRGAGGHALGDSDLTQLREQLQLLTKASNPLGKFLEAIHDDIDSMTRELEMWRSESRSQALAAAEARRQTEESLQEIFANLQNLEDAITDQVLKTNNLRHAILANDAAMEAMMRTIVNPDITAQ
ncbi:Microtubule-binding protein MIP-T3 [Novymonas esmeraldas]|uniref:TRAF3-interacting protein 1 n=1 Tax=Novymonas esmeraldas TaxID=1808958 RepID=A0AAW0ESL5_9TRYP